MMCLVESGIYDNPAGTDGNVFRRKDLEGMGEREGERMKNTYGERSSQGNVLLKSIRMMMRMKTVVKMLILQMMS